MNPHESMPTHLSLHLRYQHDEDEPTIDTTNDEEDPLVLEEGDPLLIFDIDGYFEQEPNPSQKINCTNYDYVLNKYDPQRTESKEWTDIVLNQYHNYEDIFTRKDFDKLPER